MRKLKEVNPEAYTYLAQGINRLAIYAKETSVCFAHEVFKRGYWDGVCSLNFDYKDRTDFVNKLYDWGCGDNHTLHYKTVWITGTRIELRLENSWSHFLTLLWLPNFRQLLKEELEKLFEDEDPLPMPENEDIALSIAGGTYCSYSLKNKNILAIYRPKEGKLVEIWRRKV